MGRALRVHQLTPETISTNASAGCSHRPHTSRSVRRICHDSRHVKRAAALLITMYMMVIVSSLVILSLSAITTEMSITRNRLRLARAMYTADAGIQHALGMLRADRAWRSGFPSPGIEFPPGSGNTYVVSISAGPGGEVIVTSTGTYADLSKTVRATIAVPP